MPFMPTDFGSNSMRADLIQGPLTQDEVNALDPTDIGGTKLNETANPRRPVIRQPVPVPRRIGRNA